MKLMCYLITEIIRLAKAAVTVTDAISEPPIQSLSSALVSLADASMSALVAAWFTTWFLVASASVFAA